MDQTQLLYPRSHHGLGDLQQPQIIGMGNLHLIYEYIRVLEKCGYTPFHFFWVAKNAGYAIHSRSFSSLQLLGQKCPLEAINVFD